MKIFKELPFSLFRMTELRTKRFTENGLMTKLEVPIIVSMTSIPSRLKTLDLVIKSMFDQSVRPKHIVLWLHQDLRRSIPNRLNQLQNGLFSIRFSHLNCSHRKLVHTLPLYPNDILVTIDDDCMYRSNFLELFYEEHQRQPKKIIGNYTVNLGYDDDGKIVPYGQWHSTAAINEKVRVPIGAWGVLYPPRSLAKETTDEKRYLSLTPKADDLWFKAMALKNGTLSDRAKRSPKNPVPIINTQKVALKRINRDRDLNTEQWKAIDKAYNLKQLIFS